MKTLLIASTAVFLTAFIAHAPYRGAKADASVSRELQCGIHGRYSRPVTMEKLNAAGLVSDFIPGYPVNWITEYVSVEISATCNGNTIHAIGPDAVLTTEQRNILRSADMGSDISVNVKYKYNDGVIDYTENREMHTKMTVVPAAEAEFIGGAGELAHFVKKNISKKISATVPEQFQKGSVVFTVDEEGKIVNAKISETSGDLKTDKLFLGMVYNMPKWKPAENSNGIKVKQEFVLRVGSSGGC